jgi:DNA-binding NarL/FixJ family response regulator
MRRQCSGCNITRTVSLRCLIVDDNASFREEMRGLLQEQGIDVLGDVGSAEEALQQVAELRPNLVLIDIALGDQSGFALAQALHVRANHPVPQMILISTHEESDYADLIETSPAIGFLSKTELSAAAILRILVANAVPDE